MAAATLSRSVPVENPSKVTIDQVSGTVLAGEGVLISPCVVGYSSLDALNKSNAAYFVVVLKPFGDGKPTRIWVTVEPGKTKNVSVSLE